MVPPVSAASSPGAAKSRSKTHPSRSKLAKALLVLVFFMLRIPDAWCYRFAIQPGQPPLLRPFFFAVAGWTTLLLIAVWFRKRWARYLLSAFLVGVALFDLIKVSAVLARHEEFFQAPVIATTTRIVMYCLAVVILLQVRCVRKLADRI